MLEMCSFRATFVFNFLLDAELQRDPASAGVWVELRVSAAGGAVFTVCVMAAGGLWLEMPDHSVELTLARFFFSPDGDSINAGDNVCKTRTSKCAKY